MNLARLLCCREEVFVHASLIPILAKSAGVGHPRYWYMLSSGSFDKF